MITVKTFGNYKRQDLAPELMTGCDHDRNTYCYRLLDGDMVLSCYKQRGDKQMAKSPTDKATASKHDALLESVDAGQPVQRYGGTVNVSPINLTAEDCREITKKVFGDRLTENQDGTVNIGQPVRSMGCIEPNPPSPLGVEVPKYEPEDNDYLDDEPVAYQVVEKPFDANAFRLEVIENIIEMSCLRNAPKEITLSMISGVMA